MCISALPNFFTFKKYSLRSSSETIIKAVEKIDVKLKNIDEIAKNQEIKADLNEDNEEDVDDIRLL